MRIISFIVLSLGFVFIISPVQAQDDDQSDSPFTPYLSLFLTRDGEVEFIKSIVTRSSEFLLTLLKNRENFSDEIKFGAIDKANCQKLIDDFNHGHNDVKISSLWYECIGIPSGFFAKDDFYQAKTIYRKVFKVGTKVLAGISDDNLYPHPLYVKLKGTHFKNLVLKTPDISISQDYIQVSIGVEALEMVSNITIHDTMSDEEVFQFNHFHFSIKKSDLGIPAIQISLKINGNSKSQLLIEIDPKKSKLFIPEGTISIDFDGSDQKIIDIFCKSPFITYEKEQLIRGLSKKARNYLSFLKDWKNLLDVEMVPKNFFNDPQYTKSISELFNQRVFPQIAEKLHNFLSTHPLIKGQTQEIPLAPLNEIVEDFLFENFYAEYSKAILKQKEGEKSLNENFRHFEEEGNEEAFISSFNLEMVKSDSEYSHIDDLLKSFDHSTYFLANFKLERIIVNLKGLLIQLELLKIKAIPIPGALAIINNFIDKTIDIIKKVGDLNKKIANNIEEYNTKKSQSSKQSSNQNDMPLSLFIKTSIVKENGWHGIFIREGEVSKKSSPNSREKSLKKESKNDLESHYPPPDNFITKNSLMGIHFSLSKINQLFKELYSRGGAEGFQFCYTQSKILSCHSLPLNSKKRIEVKFTTPWKIKFDPIRNQIYFKLKADILANGDLIKYQERVYLLLDLDEKNQIKMELEYDKNNPLMKDISGFMWNFLASIIPALEQVYAAFSQMSFSNQLPVELLKKEKEQFLLYLKKEG